MSKSLSVEFDDMESGSGIFDLAIRYDVKKGNYEFCVEENGVPTTMFSHEFVGILKMIESHAINKFFKDEVEL